MQGLTLPTRTTKPRETGLTAVNHMGVFPGTTTMQYVDLVKLGIGTAYLYDENNLRGVLEAANREQTAIYFGGTLFEAYVAQGKFDTYVSELTRLGITHAELSCGTIDLSLDERIWCMDVLRGNGIEVLAEVGTKDQQADWPPSKWIQEIKALKDAGAWKIVLEGRDSGTAGIFTRSGEMRVDLIHEIAEHCDVDEIIFECPNEKRQCQLIRMFGANVNVGNVAPDRVLVLEAQRVGLRYETFAK